MALEDLFFETSTIPNWKPYAEEGAVVGCPPQRSRYPGMGEGVKQVDRLMCPLARVDDSPAIS